MRILFPVDGPASGLGRRHGLRAFDLLLAALLLALWTAALGGAPLLDVDEGAFAEASREMLVSGDWGHTTLNGADRFDKPILVYWLQAASLALLGPTEAALRLPSALCAWAWCLALAAYAAPRWGRSTGWLAAGMLATSLGPLLIGRAATADALLNLLLTLTLLDLARALDDEAVDPAAGHRAWRRAFAWAGLGLLAKGPVALVVPAGTLLLWALGSGPAARLRLRQGLADPLAWVLLLAISLPWYAYAWLRHGQAFIDGFLLRHNVDRFAGALEGHGGSPLFHLLVLPLVMLPWTPLLLPLARHARLLWAHSSTRLLLAWCGFVLLFFSLAATKLPHYALYGLTPLLLLAAREAGGAPPSAAMLLAVGLMTALSVLQGAGSVALAEGWLWLAGEGPADYWNERLRAGLSLPGPASGNAALVLLALLALLLPARRLVGWRIPGLLAAAVVSALWWTLSVLPWWAQLLQGPVRELALEARARKLSLVQWQLHQPSAGFYRDQAVPRRAPRSGEAALLRSDRLDAAMAQSVLPLRVLRREPGFVLVQAGSPGVGR